MPQLLLLLAAPLSGAAEPVLLAPVSPGDPADAGLATTLGDQTQTRLVSDGLVVLDASAVGHLVSPDALFLCPLDPVSCAQESLADVPVRLAVLARLDRVGSALVGHVELVEPGAGAPAATLDVPIADGADSTFALEVSGLLRRTLESMEPSSEALRASAALLLTRAATREAPEPPEVPSDRPPARTPAAPADLPAATAPTVEGSVEERLEGTGIRRRRLLGSIRRFERSGQDPRDWVWRAAPHAGRLILEARAGFGLGDIDRQAILRAETTDGEQTNQWYREGPASSSNFRGSGYVGYAPVTLLDVGVVFGFQYANRLYNTGTWVVEGEEATLSDRDGPTPAVQAIDLYVQPRLRLYVAPVGPAKPYVILGGELKAFDAYQLAQSGALEFLVPDGALIPGAVGGVGLIIDPGPDLGLFAEGTYTRHFGPRAGVSEQSGAGDWRWADGEAPPAESTGGTVAITGGVQFRL